MARKKGSVPFLKGAWRILRQRIVWIPLGCARRHLRGLRAVSRPPRHQPLRRAPLELARPRLRPPAGALPGSAAVGRRARRRARATGLPQRRHARQSRHLAARRWPHRARDTTVPVLGRPPGIAEGGGRFLRRGRCQPARARGRRAAAAAARPVAHRQRVPGRWRGPDHPCAGRRAAADTGGTESRRGPALRGASGCGRDRHPARHLRQRHLGRDAPGCQHADPAAGSQLLPQQRAHAFAQAARGADGAVAGDALHARTTSSTPT